MKIKIKDYIWNVSIVSPDDMRLQIDNDVVFGITNFGTLDIYLVKEGIHNDVFKRTIRHELTHAYLNSYGFIGDDMNEEYICNFVEAYAEEICEQTNAIFDELTRIYQFNLENNLLAAA